MTFPAIELYVRRLPLYPLKRVVRCPKCGGDNEHVPGGIYCRGEPRA